ncbi:haloacid dehalogenase-like hydrolase (HAD) superfamily protein [Actinidia rufa]|uniref:Mitochondrial import inner membrane translocase subunit TIM50 n=1 Tax=Actinidia rufa TaxID=165716 RepID=A0A7J0G994_9ERIC|nr:haloacid dehalogenase-like hydrolase (HAD) superfamily protein [Actinidia rufa]
MSAIARYRLLSTILKNNRRLYSEIAANPSREPIISASSVVNDHQPPQHPSSSGTEKKSWGFLKYSLVAALTGGVATAGYATYAYTLDEVDEKTKALRASAKYTVDDDASALDGFTEPTSDKLLPDLHPMEQHVFTLVLDLNETLIYSDWKYVDPVVDRLDPKQCIRFRLSRGATRYQDGKHYRDLSKLNRDPAKILYVSGHALESNLQPENGVPIKPWKLEADDTALLDLLPFLEYVARHRPADIRPVLASYQGRDISKEFIERSKDHQRAANVHSDRAASVISDTPGQANARAEAAWSSLAALRLKLRRASWLKLLEFESSLEEQMNIVMS